MRLTIAKSLILLSGGLFLFFVSCQKVENENMQSISFGRVVDKYSGNFRKCGWIDIQMDTMCNPPQRSEVSIIIVNNKTIEVSEKSNNFNVAELDVVDTLNSSEGKVFYFRRVEGDVKKTLIFDQNQGFVEYVLTQNMNVGSNIEVFKGIQ